MTNGVWFKDRKELRDILSKLYHCGYDGEICISIDEFHCQPLTKLANFITSVYEIWQRPDILTIAAVFGSKDNQTKKKLKTIAKMLKGQWLSWGANLAAIKTNEFYLRIIPIDLVDYDAISQGRCFGKKQIFKNDYCQALGNVLFIEPSGEVKPCCGYANDLAILSLGNINKDSLATIMMASRTNKLINTIFTRGLGYIHKRLTRLNSKFSAKTNNSCVFCRYILTKLPLTIIEKCW